MSARRLLWPAGVALGVLAEWASGDLADPTDAVPDLLTGWTLLACGLVAWSRRPGSRAGPLLAATGALWFAGNFATDALSLYRGPLVHLLLTYPDGRARSRGERIAVGAGYAAAVVPAAWAEEPVALVLSAALLGAAADGHRRAAGALRRARGLSLAATGGLVVAISGGAIARLLYPAGEADAPALLVMQLVLCAVGIVLAAGVVSRGWERPAITDLVVELGEKRSGTLRDALARALGDPSLEVGYQIGDVYVDAEGRELVLPDAAGDRSVTIVERDGRPLAALVHDPAVLDDPALLDAIGASARMAASHARLQAAVRAQVAELQASRRRILAAGDEERRRLGQRLNDGAVRRLAGVESSLASARERADGPALDRIEHAEGLLERTLDDLDALGRGLHPRSLAEHGLAGALASLAEASPVPVELSVPVTRLPAEVERVAYFVCAEALANVAKHARASHVTLAARRSGARLLLEIADDGVGGADGEQPGLRGLADRVETLGGSLRVDSPPGRGTRLTADLPA